MANKVLAGINKKYGDPALNGAVHAFRLAGFANKKEGRNSAFTTVVQAVNRLCSKTYELIKQVKEQAVRAYEQNQTHLANLDTTLNNNVGVGLDDGGLEFDRLRTIAMQNATKKGMMLDESAADYQAAKAMLKAGYSGLDVEIAIMQHPSTTRKNNGVDYAQRTTTNAEKSLKTNNVERSDYVIKSGSKDLGL